MQKTSYRLICFGFIVSDKSALIMFLSEDLTQKDFHHPNLWYNQSS